jgi:vesicle-fusing ATPase
VRIDKIIGFDTNLALLSYGVIEDSEDLTILCKKSTASSQLINIESDRVELKEIIKDDFKSLGIGGLDKQFKEIFRRAFNSRRYPAHVLAKYDIKHVRGMLLYGPPGTGKTLIAR